MPQRKRSFMPYLLWLIPVLFFAYQFILRLWPSLMMQTVMQKFAIDATAYGVLASVYYYGYAGMQIPLAIMIDKYGVRKVLSICAFLCGVATYMFSLTDNWHAALLCRFVIGGCSAVAFLSISKIAAQLFPKSQYSRMVAFSFTIGLVGAIYGGKPINLMVTEFGWKQVSIALALVSLLIAFFAFLLLPKSTAKANAVKEEKLTLAGFKTLLSSPSIWLLGLVNFLLVGSLEGFADVWGVSYAMNAYGLSKNDAAKLLSFVYVGMLFGGPLLAIVSRYIGAELTISCCGFGMAALFMHLLTIPMSYDWHYMAAILFSIGVLCCYQVIVFAAGSEMVSLSLLSVIVAFLQCVNMMGGSFFHTVIGSLMDVFWQGEMADGIRVYTLASYNKALLVIPTCAVIGAFISLYLGIKVAKKAKFEAVVQSK